MTHTTTFEVVEVHNFGGFFGGDTVTLDAAPLSDEADVRTLVIDARALANVPDRHCITAGMVFALEMDGERVDHAELLAAQSQADLRTALGTAQIDGPLDGPLLLSARCPNCGRWVIAARWHESGCELCAQAAE